MISNTIRLSCVSCFREFPLGFGSGLTISDCCPECSSTLTSNALCVVGPPVAHKQFGVDDSVLEAMKETINSSFSEGLEVLVTRSFSGVERMAFNHFLEIQQTRPYLSLVTLTNKKSVSAAELETANEIIYVGGSVERDTLMIGASQRVLALWDGRHDTSIGELLRHTTPNQDIMIVDTGGSDGSRFKAGNGTS